jgi:hypothetical protein
MVERKFEAVSLSGEAGKQALAFEPPILGIGLSQSL